ncbi:hypothetical protein [Mycoplasma bradburyae]|uniref:hypothetical protein n=1 Tax=Mycoplasma bradburyae TaxID=2963128 RepID=UPI002341CBC6|nr:hypothetical protein [Mycoplasma bradburyae]MDC4184380.1 hypothetical protein [Mycoplasma bradburyae]
MNNDNKYDSWYVEQFRKLKIPVLLMLAPFINFSIVQNITLAWSGTLNNKTIREKMQKLSFLMFIMIFGFFIMIAFCLYLIMKTEFDPDITNQDKITYNLFFSAIPYIYLLSTSIAFSYLLKFLSYRLAIKHCVDKTPMTIEQINIHKQYFYKALESKLNRQVYMFFNDVDFCLLGRGFYTFWEARNKRSAQRDFNHILNGSSLSASTSNLYINFFIKRSALLLYAIVFSANQLLQTNNKPKISFLLVFYWIFIRLLYAFLWVFGLFSLTLFATALQDLLNDFYAKYWTMPIGDNTPYHVAIAKMLSLSKESLTILSLLPFIFLPITYLIDLTASIFINKKKHNQYLDIFKSTNNQVNL